jgi:neutral ceramidase
MAQLRFVRADGTEIGVYHWLPYHPNTSGSHLFLVHGDVNGLASYRLEKMHGTDYGAENTFVAAFAYSNAADTTGNLTEDVEVFKRLYPDENIALDARGDWIADGSHDYERMAMRADTVTRLADNLYAQEGEPVAGRVDYRQIFLHVSEFPIKPEYIDDRDIYYRDLLGEEKSTIALCRGAAGVSFMAGSMEDGNSGMTSDESNPRKDVTDDSTVDLTKLWSDPVASATGVLLGLVGDQQVTREEMDCQKEKSIAISLDEVKSVIPDGKAWSLEQPIQIIRIGQIAIVALPTEVSVMSGRRIEAELASVLPEVKHIEINANSNSVNLYLTTRQEYASQQYEGGSNIMGPYTLNAFTQVVHELAMSFKDETEYPEYGVPFSDVENSVEVVPTFPAAEVATGDGKPLGTEFGDVITDAQPQYAISTDPTHPTIVSVSFIGGHPDNDLMTQKTYLKVQKIASAQNTEATTVANDWDPETRFIWTRQGTDQSIITIEWYVPADAEPGQYRIDHYGYAKDPLTQQLRAYQGQSRTFQLKK